MVWAVMPLLPKHALLSLSLQSSPRHGSEGDSLSVKSCCWVTSYQISCLNFSSMSWKLPVYSGKWIPQESGALELPPHFKLLHEEPQAVFWHLFSGSGTALFLTLACSFCSLSSLPFLGCQHHVLVAYVTNQMSELICLSCNPERM